MILPSGLTLPMGRITEICRRYGVKELSVFGSAARGEMRPDSDLDLLAEFLPDRKIGWEFFELEEELTRVLARRVDLGSKRSLKPWVRADALRDARVIYAA